jgi:hypothetical protein
MLVLTRAEMVMVGVRGFSRWWFPTTKRAAYDRAEWRECIQKCRDVRTYVERAVRYDEGEHVAAAVARRLGTNKDDPRIKFLDSVWAPLVNLTSGAHHVDTRDRLEQRPLTPRCSSQRRWSSTSLS